MLSPNKELGQQLNWQSDGLQNRRLQVRSLPGVQHGEEAKWKKLFQYSSAMIAMNRDTSQITVNDQIGRFESSLPHHIWLCSSTDRISDYGSLDTRSNRVRASKNGPLAEWLGTCLQNMRHWFKSSRDLQVIWARSRRQGVSFARRTNGFDSHCVHQMEGYSSW